MGGQFEFMHLTDSDHRTLRQMTDSLSWTPLGFYLFDEAG